MRSSNNFSEYYKTISNAELINIISNQRDYQPLAVEAAKKELLERQLSDTDIKEAKQLLIDKQLQKDKQREKLKANEEKAKATVNTLIDTLNPIQPDIPSTERTIRFIVIIFGGLFLYQLFSDFKMHIVFVKDFTRFPFESTLYLVPLVLLPVAIFTFWKKIKIGWSLITIYSTFSAVEVLWTIIQMRSSTNSLLDNPFPQPTILSVIIQLIFFGGIIYAVCKQNIRNEFSVNENKMTTTIIISGVLAFFLIYASL